LLEAFGSRRRVEAPHYLSIMLQPLTANDRSFKEITHETQDGFLSILLWYFGHVACSDRAELRN
jgi:hypothetical protein